MCKHITKWKTSALSLQFELEQHQVHHAQQYRQTLGNLRKLCEKFYMDHCSTIEFLEVDKWLLVSYTNRVAVTRVVRQTIRTIHKHLNKGEIQVACEYMRLLFVNLSKGVV